MVDQWCSGRLKSSFAGCIGDTHLSVSYLMREKKKRFEDGFKPLLESKAKPPPLKQFVK